MKKPALLERLTLRGLSTAPSQVHGAVRMVPLKRQHVRDDIRIGLRRHVSKVGVTAIDGSTVDDVFAGRGTALVSIVPHSLIVRTSEQGPVAALGTQLLRGDEDTRHIAGFPVQAMHRIVKQVDETAATSVVRFAPLHLAIERLLSVAFAGPEIDWPEVSKLAFRHGMIVRGERAIGGRGIAGFDEAIRTFELHDDQVGVAVYVDDVLASVVVVPHPDDWRAMHHSLLEDFWCELFAWSFSKAHVDRVRFDETRVNSIDTLRAELARAHVDDGQLRQALLTDVLERRIDSQRVRTLGSLSLQRFHTDLAPRVAHHVGEVIARDDGTIEYLKTFRLSDAQGHRAHLLQTLAKQHFKLVDAALALHCSPEQLVDRIGRAGFSSLFRPEVLARYAQTGEVRR